MLSPSPAQQENPGSLGDTNIQDWQRLLGDWHGDGVGLSEGAGRSPVLWTVGPQTSPHLASPAGARVGLMRQEEGWKVAWEDTTEQRW